MTDYVRAYFTGLFIIFTMLLCYMAVLTVIESEHNARVESVPSLSL